MDIPKPRLLLIDSYDSFTHNLAALCLRAIPNCIITIVKNDELDMQILQPYLRCFSAIIVGPGPGSPDKDADVGIVKYLWKVHDPDVLPIFGVCLGLQCLAFEYGASLRRLKTVKHGQISQINHHAQDLFSHIGDIKAVRYHSLHVELPVSSVIQELAWANDEDNGRIVMAVRHTHRPFWAVQYHPESACTDEGGLQVLQNFWTLARRWLCDSGRQQSEWNNINFGRQWPPVTPSHYPFQNDHQPSKVHWARLYRQDLSVIDIAEAFGVNQESSSFIFLDSAADPGHHSIIASLMPSTINIQYRIENPYVTLFCNGTVCQKHLGGSSVWSWLGRFMQKQKFIGGPPELPFWGGLIGLLSYELGVDSLSLKPRRFKEGSTNKQPDVNLTFVQRSIVVDTKTGHVYVQSIVADDIVWIDETVKRLEHLLSNSSTKSDKPSTQGETNTSMPDKNIYIKRILQAQEHLSAGDSYELCLTAQTRISVPSCPERPGLSSSWERYKRLRRVNPAPHSAYIRLHPTTVLASSPERFLSFSRPPGTLCQLRPIKGTVQKGPGVSRSVAEKALAGNAKEVAENLMIVDLIRHDLYGLIGDGVRVKQFCSVEEFETVWQLVSVIEGQKILPCEEDQLGWNVLSRCLPPGSMTGAPKKRSVEIIQTLEDDERGIYSGVFGYWCVSGAGDWSVTIRSCVKYQDSSDTSTNEEEWLIGAGGAITALSNPESEWEEMQVKLHSVSRAFGANPLTSVTGL